MSRSHTAMIARQLFVNRRGLARAPVAYATGATAGSGRFGRVPPARRGRPAGGGGQVGGERRAGALLDQRIDFFLDQRRRVGPFERGAAAVAAAGEVEVPREPLLQV